MAENLKLKTAGSIKWNTIDRISTQLLYAVVGIVLANLLSERDFGLVGLLLGFQAFANLFVDSGFGTALLQKKDPSQTDYSTVFWFNLSVSIIIYIALYFFAPLIADIFHGEQILIPLSRLLFLTFVINAFTIVQTNRLMKQMDVKMLAIANSIGLVVSGIVGIWLACTGANVWALVWQYLTLAAVKALWLWFSSSWRPSPVFSLKALKSICRIGFSVFSSSMLNTICLQIYTFVIGAYNFISLGIYTQADKWSKMSSASLSQIFTATFVPLLSSVQDDALTWKRYIAKTNRFTAFILFPVMLGLCIAGEPLFHTLFGNKWDAAIPIYQILTFRGIFIVLLSLYNNYILAAGAAKLLFIAELIKDSLIFIAIMATMWSGSLTIIVWGQFIASAITWIIILILTARKISVPAGSLLSYLLTPLLIAVLACAAAWTLNQTNLPAPAILVLIILAIATIYIGLAAMLKLPELTDVSAYILGRFKKKRNTTI